MTHRRNLKTIIVQSGSRDDRGLAIEGFFEVSLDMDHIREQMARAARNKSNLASDGPVVITYKSLAKAQADYLVEAKSALLAGSKS